MRWLPRPRLTPTLPVERRARCPRGKLGHPLVDSRAPPSTLVVLQTLGRGREVLSKSTVEIYRFFINVIGTITFFFRAKPFYWDWQHWLFCFSLFVKLRWSGGLKGFLKCPGTRSWFFPSKYSQSWGCKGKLLWPFWLVFAVELCNWH